MARSVASKAYRHASPVITSRRRRPPLPRAVHAFHPAVRRPLTAPHAYRDDAPVKRATLAALRSLTSTMSSATSGRLEASNTAKVLLASSAISLHGPTSDANWSASHQCRKAYKPFCMRPRSWPCRRAKRRVSSILDSAPHAMCRGLLSHVIAARYGIRHSDLRSFGCMPRSAPCLHPSFGQRSRGSSAMGAGASPCSLQRERPGDGHTHSDE